MITWRVVEGAKIASEAGDHIDKWLAKGVYYERALLEAIRQRGRSGVYVDCGAHVGNHSVFFLRECKADRLVAYEPYPETHHRLIASISENAGKIPWHAVSSGLHDTWTRASIVEPPTGNRGMARLVEDSEGRVVMTRLDVSLPPLIGIDRLGVVKIDCEGLSASVLASGARLIARDRPLIAAEAQDANERAAIDAVLRPLGYLFTAGPYGATPVWMWSA